MSPEKCALCGKKMGWTALKYDNPEGKGKICHDCYEKIDESEIKFTIDNILVDISKYSDYKGKYLVVFSETSADPSCIKLNKAINKMADIGWRCVNITSSPNFDTIIYVLLERI